MRCAVASHPILAGDNCCRSNVGTNVSCRIDAFSTVDIDSSGYQTNPANVVTDVVHRARAMTILFIFLILVEADGIVISPDPPVYIPPQEGRSFVDRNIPSMCPSTINEGVERTILCRDNFECDVYGTI